MVTLFVKGAGAVACTLTLPF